MDVPLPPSPSGPTSPAPALKPIPRRDESIPLPEQLRIGEIMKNPQGYKRFRFKMHEIEKDTTWGLAG